MYDKIAHSSLLFYANQFRNAIDAARNDARFPINDRMRRFPQGCCDDTSDLFAYFLRHKGIPTIQVNGKYQDDDPEHTQNHVWLKTDDDIIVDLTGDQFKNSSLFRYYNIPVYVGEEDTFHSFFSDRIEILSFDFTPNETEGQRRMFRLFSTIMKYIDE